MISHLPVRRQPADTSIKCQQRTILLSLQIHRLPSTTENTKTIVTSITSRTQGKSITALPSPNIGPSHHVLADSMAPRNVTPVDMVRMPLVEYMVLVTRRIVHRGTGIVHPPSGCVDVRVRTPAGEEGVVAHGADLVSRDGGAAGITGTAAIVASGGAVAIGALSQDGR